MFNVRQFYNIHFLQSRYKTCNGQTVTLSQKQKKRNIESDVVNTISKTIDLFIKRS